MINKKNIVKNFGQFINEGITIRDQLYDKIEDYYNKHNNDGYLKLDFEIKHNYKNLHFIQLYKYDGDIIGDDFCFYFKDENEREANWYLSTIDTQTLNTIVKKMIDDF
jgi:hypothetical protein